MRIIIYLASHDSQARANWRNLHNDRRDRYQHQVVDVDVEVRSGKLAQDPNDKTDPFANIPPDKYDSVKIEFIAHGNPAYSAEILSRRIKPDAIYSQSMIMLGGEHYNEISPQMILDFFNENENAKDWQTKKFKFKWLVLYACTSDKFALEISRLFPEIYIVSFRDLITIKDDGNIYLPDNRTPSIPVIYLDRALQEIQVLENFVFEFQDKPKIEDGLLANLDAYLKSATSSASKKSSSLSHSPSESSSPSSLASLSSPSVSSSGHFSSSSSETSAMPSRDIPAAENAKKNKFKPS